MITDNNFTDEPQALAAWSRMSYAQKNKALYERQVALLQLFLEKHAIDRTQYEKSLHDLNLRTNH